MSYDNIDIVSSLTSPLLSLPSDKDSFANREFSYTLQDDIYVRYQSFTNREALEESIKTTIPHKIDIGAIFNHKVSQ